MHSCLLNYKGFTVIVDNYIYRIQIFPLKAYSSFQDCKNIIDELDRTINKSFVVFPSERITDESENDNEGLEFSN
jgi:hypothetical protein